MNIEDLNPALQDAARRLPGVDFANPLVRRFAALAVRLMPATKVPGSTRRVVHAYGVRLITYRPTDQPPLAALLWIHGGGLITGAAVMDDRFCGELARDHGLLVASVDYRLPPGHPFPVPLNECRAGWEWLTNQAAELGIAPGRIAVGGQSAGGGMAAALVQRLHDEGIRPAAQWLFCPMLHDRTAADRSLDATGHLAWDNPSNLIGWSAYLQQAPGAASVPEYSVPARRADLSGLPPAWLYSSDIELFHAEIVSYSERLAMAGVPVQLETVPDAPHGFESWASDTVPARELVTKARTWLAEQLNA